MKQQEAVRESIGDYNFYITPFPAMTAANMTGELAAVAAPLLGALAPVLGAAVNTKNDENEEGSVLDVDVSDALPGVTRAFSSLSGDKLERLMMKLLVDHQNIAYEGIDDDKAHRLKKDDVNEIFCGNVQDMFILALKVIKLNYSGFFEKLASRFGSLERLAEKLEKTTSEDTADSMKAGSRS